MHDPQVTADMLEVVRVGSCPLDTTWSMGLFVDACCRGL